MNMNSKMQDLKIGFKSLLQPRVLLVILIYVANQYGNNMMNGFQSKLATDSLGIGADIVGIAVTVFTLAGFLMRAPSGYITDNFNAKKALIAAFVLKIGVNVLYALIPEGAVFFYLVVRFLHGVTWSIVGVMTVALLGAFVDRRAAGTAYALLMALSSLLCSTARPLALRFLEERGGTFVALLVAAITLVPIILTLFIKLDKHAFAKKTRAGEKKSLVKLYTGSIVTYMIPLAVLSAIPMLGFNCESVYLAQLAEEAGAEYLATLTAAGAISSIVVLGTGILCDIISPYIVLTLMLGMSGVGLFLMGSSTTAGMMSAGIWLYYLGRSQFNQFTIIGMKCVSHKHQGALQGTMNLFKDLLTMFWGPLLGALIVNFNYGFTFKFSGIVALVTIVLVWVSKFVVLDKFTEKALAEAKEEQAGETTA